jgi:asparagine synthase (glutamine-hydrolysing)
VCGIAGLLDLKDRRRFDPELIRRMTARIAHRGPDGEGFFECPGLALGHRRLSIIDLAGGGQPMSLPDGSVAVSFNGEIYNFKILRRQLEERGHRFRSESDTECLLHGWREWGAGLVDHLRGMFAFALWDESEQRLFLARDRLGKKPLHYTILKDGTLAFASEIKALLTLPGVDSQLSPSAVDDFFAFGYVPDPETIYKAIKKLPPAHRLIATRNEIYIDRYWDLLANVGSCAFSETQQDMLVERLAEAVRLRLVSDVEIGAFLSGGVDSSAVVALMAQEGASPVNTFSIGFGEKTFDETAYADTVARLYRTNHRRRIVEADSAALLPQLAGIFDEPFGDISAIPTFLVCAETAKVLKVCLSGDGGDETLAGYRRYGAHAKQEVARRLLPPGLREAAFGTAGHLYPKLDRAPRILRAKTTFQELALSSAEAYFRMLCALPDEIRLPLYSDDFVGQLGGHDPKARVRELFGAARDFDPLQQAQYVDLNLYLASDILVKVDRTSMANALEVRTPFLDHEFVTWAFGLPSGLKRRHGEGKWLLKHAMERYLPIDLLYRPKQGFTLPLSSWLRGPMYAEVSALCESAALRSCGLFDMEEIATRAQMHRSGARDHAKSLWLLLVFEAFLDHMKTMRHVHSERADWRPAATRPA